MRPGYKQTEVGVIPEDWDVRTLADVTTKVGSGITPRGGNRAYHPHGRPFVRSQNIGWGELLLADLAFIDEETHASFAATELNLGDVLLNITGASIGRSAVVQEAIAGGNVNQHVCVVRPVPTTDYRFLGSLLLSALGQRQIDSFQAGGNREGLNFKQVRSLTFPFPEKLPEQRAIAEALADADAAVAGLERLIAKKRDLKQAAMQQLLTGQTRLPGFSGAWEVKRLGDHVSFLRNGTLSRAQLTTGDSTRYLHYGDIHGSIGVFLCPDTIDMPTVPAALVTRLDRLQSGDLIFADASEDLDGVGKSIEVQLCDAGLEVVSGLHTIAARFDKDVLADGFKAYLQFMPLFGAHLKKHAAGTKVLATNRAHIASVELPLPTPEEQRAISTVFRDMDAELTALQAQLDKTRLIKQAMMQDLLTGRVRLPFQ